MGLAEQSNWRADATTALWRRPRPMRFAHRFSTRLVGSEGNGPISTSEESRPTQCKVTDRRAPESRRALKIRRIAPSLCASRKGKERSRLVDGWIVGFRSFGFAPGLRSGENNPGPIHCPTANAVQDTPSTPVYQALIDRRREVWNTTAVFPGRAVGSVDEDPTQAF